MRSWAGSWRNAPASTKSSRRWSRRTPAPSRPAEAHAGPRAARRTQPAELLGRVRAIGEGAVRAAEEGLGQHREVGVALVEEVVDLREKLHAAREAPARGEVHDRIARDLAANVVVGL